MNGLRLAIGTFTVFPVSPPTKVDSFVARRAMLLAPAIGLLLGAIAALVLWGVRSLSTTAFGNLLGAALAIALLAYLTRALHLDGLADTADALGSRRRGDAALEIAKRGDVGPFGVVALVLILIIDIVALGAAAAAHHGTLAVITAVATGRLAATWGCIRGISAARSDGLGALVAGTVPVTAAAAWTVVLPLLVTGLALLDDDRTVRSVVCAPIAILAGLAAAAVLVRRSRRRLGGITGDVLGASVELATATALMVAALA